MSRWFCVLALLLCGALPAAACVGDCSGDGSVTVDEIVLGVSAALGAASIDECRIFDSDQSGSITVDELLTAINNALAGCGGTPTASESPATPTPTVTIRATTTASVSASITVSPSRSPTALPTATVTPTSTTSSTPTIEPTATATPEAPLLAPTPFVYRGFTGHPIELPIGVGGIDPDELIYQAADLPEGASLDPETAAVYWTPQAEQFGTFYVPWWAHHAAHPEEMVSGLLTFQVEPDDPCIVVECDAAIGCTSSLIPVTETCCEQANPVHLAEPVLDCPEGRLLLVGANRNGFGRLSHCDPFVVANRAQAGADISLHVAARCINSDFRVTVRARLDMERPGQGTKVLVDDQIRVDLAEEADGFAVRRGLRFAVVVPGPFFDFQDAEANLHVELVDAEQTFLSDSIRVRLTFTPIATERVDPSPLPTPTPAMPPA